jgi:hypothetical protein
VHVNFQPLEGMTFTYRYFLEQTHEGIGRRQARGGLQRQSPGQI